jgi:hypothetical protein
MFGLELDAKVQTRVICLFILLPLFAEDHPACGLAVFEKYLFMVGNPDGR